MTASDNDTAYHRAGICAWCKNMQLRHNPVSSGIDGWCGEPAKATASTCGCVVLTIEASMAARAVAENPEGGEPLRLSLIAVSGPDGKTRISAEKCPSEKW